MKPYGSGGVYRPGRRVEKRTFPGTHSKKIDHRNPGALKEVLKLGAKSVAAYFGVPSSYASVPITALFSDFGQAGEKRLNPDRAARRLGYKDAANQQLMIKHQKEKEKQKEKEAQRTKR